MIIKYTKLIVVVLPIDVGSVEINVVGPVEVNVVGPVEVNVVGPVEVNVAGPVELASFIAQLKLFRWFRLWILTVFCSGDILHSIKYETSKSGHVV